MGQGQSDASGEAAQSPFDSLPSDDRHGWKVMQVLPSSPSSGLGLIPYLSVLTHVDGGRVGREESDLVPLIVEGRPAQLTFLDLSTLQSRVVTVTPRRGWGGDGLLGLMIRHDWFENAHLEAIHVLEVHPGSPAERAGLRAHTDFMLGTARLAYKGYEALDLFLTQHQDRVGRIVVFNKEDFTVREVDITPSEKWGGAGSLGCDVGVGFLHQLPIDGKRAVRYADEDATTPQVQQQQQQQTQSPLPAPAVPQQQQQQGGQSFSTPPVGDAQLIGGDASQQSQSQPIQPPPAQQQFEPQPSQQQQQYGSYPQHASSPYAQLPQIPSQPAVQAPSSPVQATQPTAATPTQAATPSSQTSPQQQQQQQQTPKPQPQRYYTQAELDQLRQQKALQQQQEEEQRRQQMIQQQHQEQEQYSQQQQQPPQQQQQYDQQQYPPQYQQQYQQQYAAFPPQQQFQQYQQQPYQPQPHPQQQQYAPPQSQYPSQYPPTGLP